MNNNTYTVRQMVRDSTIATILCLYIVVLSYFNLIYSSVLLFFIPLAIGLYFKDKKINRAIVFSAVILMFSLFYIIFYHVILIVPNILLGVLIVLLLNIKNKRLFYTFSIPIFFIVDALNDLIYARLILGINYFEFLTEHIFISSNTIINKYITLFTIFYLMLNLTIGICKVVILKRGLIIYNKRIKVITNR